MAAIYLQRVFGDDFLELDIPFVSRLPQGAWSNLRSMVASDLNCPETSSMGRLFDAVSSLVGGVDVVNYEGQAAMALEAIADAGCPAGYEFDLDFEGGLVYESSVISSVVADLLAGTPAPIISAKFHQAVVDLIVTVALRIKEERGLNRVVLSGGVFQNFLLLERLRHQLQSQRFEVFTHSRVPPNDGGISLGQSAIAHALVQSGSID